MCDDQLLYILALVRQFEEQGYLLLHDMLGAEQVASLNAAVDNILAAEPESLSYNIYNSVDRYQAILSLIDHPDCTSADG